MFFKYFLRQVEFSRPFKTVLHIQVLFKSVLTLVRKVAKIRNRYNQVPHLTQDTTWESDKYTIKHQERQEVSPFPAGDQKAAMNRQESMTSKRHKLRDLKRSPHLLNNVKIGHSQLRLII